MKIALLIVVIGLGAVFLYAPLPVLTGPGIHPEAEAIEARARVYSGYFRDTCM